jgi:HEPN domain-containing protein
MGILGEHLDRLDSDLGGMEGLGDEDGLREAYQSYHSVRKCLNEVMQTKTYVAEIESILEKAARLVGVDTTERETTVWYLGGCHRRGDHAVELATYLTARQIGTRYDHHAVYQSYVTPVFIRAELLVRTPEWVVQYVRTCDPTGADECSAGYVLTDVECDYLRGLWRGEVSGLARTIQTAKRLARAAERRAVQ